MRHDPESGPFESGSPIILLVGPCAGRPILDEIAAVLTAEGHEVAQSFDLDGWYKSPVWPLTEILLVSNAMCGRSQFELAPRLRAVVSPTLGFEWIDVQEATPRNIAVINGEVPENRESMAEAAILLMLALLYRLPQTRLAAGSASEGVEPDQRSMLKGKKIGLVGYGGIVRAIVERLRPWGCELAVFSRRGIVAPDPKFMSLDALLEWSDVVVVATSLTTDSRRLLNRESMSRMKHGVFLVNIARGAIVDETALAELLRSGHIAGAALDVFEVEPLPASSPLRALANVILTPHAIGHTRESRRALIQQAAANIVMVLKGQLPASCRNPEISARWIARTRELTT